MQFLSVLIDFWSIQNYFNKCKGWYFELVAYKVHIIFLYLELDQGIKNPSDSFKYNQGISLDEEFHSLINYN